MTETAICEACQGTLVLQPNVVDDRPLAGDQASLLQRWECRDCGKAFELRGPR